MDLKKFDLPWSGMDAMKMSRISRNAVEIGLMRPTGRKDGKSGRSFELGDSSRTCTVCR